MEQNRESDQAVAGLYRPEFEHDACGIGALAHLKGRRSHQMIDDALSVLVNLEHRGGVGLEKNTGDGAGILFQIPHRFFRKEAQKCGCLLPSEGDYGVAMLFLPRDEEGIACGMRVFEEGCARNGITLLFWRDVPVDPHDLGETARECMPTIKQAFLGRPDDVAAGEEFERRLYLCRRTIEKAAAVDPGLSGRIFYVCSMSSRTIVYKGMLVSTQMRRFFCDLDDASTETAVALVHSRYSTNTTPSWERAHPNRYIVHNGEINTLRCNISWTRARESNLYSPVMGEDLSMVLPILNNEGSDSAMLDNLLEFIAMNGRSLPRAVSMVLPEPWDNNEYLSDKRRAWDAYQSMLTEAWDGPAAIAFSDGRLTGATIDRNGLRPARYYVTADDRLILSSEVGVLDVDPASILISGSLGPGQMLLVDPDQGRVLFDDEIKDAFANEKPYRSWIDAEMLRLEDLVADGTGANDEIAVQLDEGMPLHERQAAHGYFFDDIEDALIPMARNGAMPLASMGADTPLACLSEHPRSFFDYFNQLFAQVTNPPIDALRESFITSTMLYVGNHGNLLEDARANCRLVRLETPLLDRAQFEALAGIEQHGFKSVRLHAAYPSHVSSNALDEALSGLLEQAENAVRNGADLVVVSDRAAEGEVPIPSLLAVAAVHNRLLRAGLRTHADIIVESGDAITPHDFAALVGYSASGIYPYLAHETLESLCVRGVLESDAGTAIANYNRAVVAGIVAIMSKMGISTMQGYHAAQVFEAVGLSDELIAEHFAGTVSRVGGLGIDDVQRECDERHARARALLRSPSPDQLPSSGIASWRPIDGEDHLIRPTTINLLQRAVRENSPQLFEEYSASVHQEGRAIVLRDLLEFAPTGAPIPLEAVEPASEIVKRFNTGAMSYGSISQEAHECLAIAMNRLHGRSNSGEGGEDPARETTLPNGDSRRSAIKQIASGRFGVTSRYLMSADEIQIKMAQGAKPGEGGHLPGGKVWPWIARARRSTPGVGLISPPPHHDIYSIEDLAEIIFDMKNANPRARISVKLVAEAGVGTIATGVAKGGAHKILVSGSNGGTGAAPRDSIYHAGLPLELGLAETQQTLLRNGLRSRVVLEADGKLMDGRDVAIACLLGAEEFGFATMPLVAMGCLMQRDCQQDTCPVGIATQNGRLRCHFHGKPEYVVNFMMMVAEQLRRIMAQLGFATVEEMVGHAECLRQHHAARSWKARLVDLSPLLAKAQVEYGRSIPGADCPHFLSSCAPEDTLPQTLDATLLVPYTRASRKTLSTQRFHIDVANTNRCVGTMLGAAVTRRHADGLPDGMLTVDCTGSAGVSFGAFLPAGITLNIEGEANDFLGKGLSGGIVSVAPARTATYRPEENIVAGNVAFYGATGGRGFVCGVAGQRFAVRNSGATLVVEGVGNNGCEYMTGGIVLVLGEVGLNFAAGMSGGIAYVYDAEHTLAGRCNREMVDLEAPARDELACIRALIDEHTRRTGSALGAKLLYQFDDIVSCFVKVVPREYAQMIALTEQLESQGLSHDAAVERAFEMRNGAPAAAPREPAAAAQR
ncbi:MAG: glutamate synthase large subunit [Coriobacteriaceae bacterium]|nr:glutamate synthase large subunit [Coriobacteriaceae bacterium]